MDAIPSWPAFLLAVVLIAASPGPAMALILRRAALGGFRAAVPTVLGLELGLYAWALLAAAGFAGLVAASEVAFLVLRVVGAAVLCWLGVQALRAAWCERSAGRSGTTALPSSRRGGWAGFGEGVIVQLANPKAAVFVIAFYPQFVPADRPLFATTAVFALVQVALETVLYLLLAAGVARAGTWFRRPRVRAWLEGVSGTVLVGLGLRVAVTSR
ncbi:Threonine/homoserine/homoserine lactone efflux protein [Geodermatophilus amargosae]|uniref:Threonine/homoserine/homoserine lactone efflux protein n=1 Tax=Geodermatophilus amargosae TaxID=1296565 RepID=A0A1I6XBP4_9ACTN|nr:LysE family translocator [Geodermatophilus amargosae]SFT35677.1 Threonine/homoserine/homoserine lactone efflux protein [Geodermatophilus amargosae]